MTAVPTNIITGYLGTGKTTTILNLLATKPADEKWAVLVNEFGEIGIDGHLISGAYGEEGGVYVREVPGGCMCCTAGLPMDIAMALLLNRVRPDRLLVEPTGLGHPIEVLQVLAGWRDRAALTIHQTIALVDARHLFDRRYTQSETYNQQISIADLVVGNKVDHYQASDREALEDYVRRRGAPGARVVFADHGRFDSAYLRGESKMARITLRAPIDTAPAADLRSAFTEDAIPACGVLKAENEGEGFRSVGWRFSPARVFDHGELVSFLMGVEAIRMKGVFITEQGVMGFNLASGVLTEMALDECPESRIEIIASEIDDSWDAQLEACMHVKPQ